MRPGFVMNFAKARRFVRTSFGAALLLMLVLAPRYAAAQTVEERIWFPAYENVTNVLVGMINAEPATGRIDVSAWYLSEHSISIALRNAFVRGVEIRLIGDRVGIHENDHRSTRLEFFWLAMQGVPIIVRFNPTSYPEIDHWKAMIFKGQRKVVFGSANFTPSELKFNSSTDYKDETVLVTNEEQIVNAFLAKFDHFWADDLNEPSSRVARPYFLDWDEACAREPVVNTSSTYPGSCSVSYANYKAANANVPQPDMVVNRARQEPDFDYALLPNMVWSQGTLFNNRLIQEINAENTAIDLVVYRLTVPDITNALLNRLAQGIRVRLLLEPTQYWFQLTTPPQGARAWPEFWLTKAYVDKLWAAGATIKQRAHAGLTHMKLLVTSNVATNASSNFAAGWQRDHNYFIPAATKPTLYNALKGRFEEMFNPPPDTVPPFTNFTPNAPDAAALVAPANATTGVSTTPTLTWNRAPFATSYDVFIWPAGTAQPANPVQNVPAALNNNPPSTYSFVSAALPPGTTFNWRIRSRTFAATTDPSAVRSCPTCVAFSATRTFTTVSGGSLPQDPALPSGWQTQDVGSVAQPGSASFSNGVFTVRGSGSNIWGTADGFRYVYQPTSGDTQIVAQVTGIGNTSTYAKAGIMLRASTAANSAHVVLSVRPNNAGLEFMTRTSTGGQTTFLKTATQPLPAWIRLTRVGSTVTAAVSANGTTWTNIWSTPVSFSSSALAGLVVCANSTALNTSTFESVSVGSPSQPPPPPPPTLPSPWQTQDVGSVGQAGSASFDPTTEVFTVRGSGSNIWGTSDGFRYVYQPTSGDTQIVAQVTGIGNTSTYAKAGIMLRASTAANSAHVVLSVRPNNAGLEFMTRTSTGAQTTFLKTATQPLPAWIRLTRVGSTVTAAVSANGTTWTDIWSTPVSFSSSALAGLVVCANSTALNTSTFDSVSVTDSE